MKNFSKVPPCSKVPPRSEDRLCGESPQKRGFRLEELIHHKIILKYPQIKCLRECDIKRKFKATAIDHLIISDSYIIYLQDKATKKISLPTLSHFILETTELHQRYYPSRKFKAFFVTTAPVTKRCTEKLRDNFEIISGDFMDLPYKVIQNIEPLLEESVWSYLWNTLRNKCVSWFS